MTYNLKQLVKTLAHMSVQLLNELNNKAKIQINKMFTEQYQPCDSL